MTNFWATLGGLLLASGLGGAALADQAENICAQSELKALGYYSGEITGRIDAASKAAGEAYRNYMMANYPGWGQAPLSSQEAGMWCKQLAAANPNKLSQYLQAAQGSAGLVHVTSLTVEGATTTKQPYTVRFDFRSEGEVSITAACFTWNGRDQVCIPLPEGTRKGPIKVGLTTGRAGTYNLNGLVKYESSGKAFLSPETSVEVIVQ